MVTGRYLIVLRRLDLSSSYSWRLKSIVISLLKCHKLGHGSTVFPILYVSDFSALISLGEVNVHKITFTSQLLLPTISTSSYMSYRHGIIYNGYWLTFVTVTKQVHLGLYIGLYCQTRNANLPLIYCHLSSLRLTTKVSSVHTKYMLNLFFQK